MAVASFSSIVIVNIEEFFDNFAYPQLACDANVLSDVSACSYAQTHRNRSDVEIRAVGEGKR